MSVSPVNTNTSSTSILSEADLEQRLKTNNLNFKGLTLPAISRVVESWGTSYPRGLTDKSLRGAQFRYAILRGIDFGTADVANADFSDADLTDADLSLVKNLQPHQLSGANLSRAKLPENVAKFDALANVAELSKNAGTLFSILLIGCVFVLIVTYTTKDIQMLLDSGTATLPVINLAVNPRLFLGVGPWVLFGQYVTMHLYLQRLWVLLATLPAIFPDGTPLDRKSYPWLLNDLIRAHFPILRKESPPLAPTQLFVFHILTYYLVPLTAFLVFVRCLMRQDWLLSMNQIICLALFVGAQALFRHVARFTLENDEEQKNVYGDWKKHLWHRKTVIWMVSTAVILTLLGPGCVPLGQQLLTHHELLHINGEIVKDTTGKPIELERSGAIKLRELFASPWKITDLSKLEEDPATEAESAPGPPPQVSWNQIAFLWRGSAMEDTTLQPTGYVLPSPLFNEVPSAREIAAVEKGETTRVAQLREEREDNKATTWIQRRKEKPFSDAWKEINAKVKPGSLSHRWLRYLQAQQAYFVNADFRYSALDGASLSGANFVGAQLDHATFKGADLSEAVLIGAILYDAVLTETNLHYAILIGAQLNNATLNSADLREANFMGANLNKANLIMANLTDALVEGASLRGAQLIGANLEFATLKGADLREANLRGAQAIDNANLDGAIYSIMETIWPDGTKNPPKTCSYWDNQLMKTVEGTYEKKSAEEYGLHLNDPAAYVLVLKITVSNHDAIPNKESTHM